jgi:hypothetical protein
VFDRERKKRLDKSEKQKTGNDKEILEKLYHMLQDAKGSDIKFENFDMKYCFAEIKADEKGEVGVIEDIPSNFDEVVSLSFDLLTDGKKDREIIFDREGIRIFPHDKHGYEKSIANDILSSR